MSTMMIRVAQLWWEWMAAMSVQVAVLVVIIGLLDRLLGRKAWPQLRTVLWLLVAIKLVIPPTVSSPVSISKFGPSVPASTANVVATAADGLAVIGFGVWSVGLVLLLVAGAWRYQRLRREWLGGDSEAPPEWFLGLAARSAERLNLQRVPTVRVQRGISGPAVIGFLRPVVVVPATLVARADRIQIEHVLLHEFAHIRRRDPLWGLAFVLIQLVYWFHPLVWLARERLGVLREIRCDETVASVLGRSTPEYRRTLIEMAAPMIGPPVLGGMGFVHRHSALMARLEWLERPFSGHLKIRRIASAVAFVLLLVCCVPLAPPTIQKAVPDQPALEELEGCLQLRFAVYRALAQSKGLPTPD